MSQFKDLRKAAFAVAFGVTMGKFAAEMVQATITGVGLGTLKFAAKNGSEIAKETCEKSGIEIEPEKKEDPNKVVRFHV